MCGRYYIDDTTAREVEKAVGRLDGKLDMTCGDVLPSQGAVVLRNQRGRLTADVMTWGFPGIDKGKLLINARAESALEKKTFRESMLHRRCIIPARGFYEWDRSRTKFSYERKDAPVMFMAGCYDLYEDEERFVILTTEANPSVSPVHERMPLILEPRELQNWVLDDGAVEPLLQKTPVLLDAFTEYEQMSLF